MNKILTAIGDWFASLYGSLLYRVQNTEWWKAHVAKEHDKEWKIAEAAAIESLNVPEYWYEIAKILVSNEYQSVRASDTEQKGPYDRKNNLVLASAVRMIERLHVLSNIVGVQPLQALVGLGFIIDTILTDDQQIKLEVNRYPIASGSRKLQAAWNVEVCQDLTINMLDAEAELINAVGHEIAEEVVTEVLMDLLKAATPTELAPRSRSLSNDRDRLLVEINKTSSAIAARSRRSCANFIVASPMVISALQCAASFKFVAAEKTSDPTLWTLAYFGKLNDTLDVYCSTLPQFEHTVLVGFKGKSGQMDTGYVYAPYIPLMTTGVVINPMTFSPEMRMLTRYGKFAAKPNGNIQTDVANYYGMIDTSSLDLLNIIPFPVDEQSTQIDNESSPDSGVKQ